MDRDEPVRQLAPRLRAGVAAWRPGAVIRRLEPLTGGASSLTFVAEVAGGTPGRVVVKMAPPGLAPVRNRDVLRQARLMRALAGTAVPVPRVLFEDEGRPPEVPPYLAMDLHAGECVEPVLEPAESRPSPAEVRSRYLAAASSLARLHAVEPAAVGLGAEPLVTLADEIDRWVRAFATVPEDLRGGYEEVATLLRASAPEPLRPVINHGDYRLGNLLCQDGRVEAIIDWEIWSVGDPRLDLTWLTFFTDEATHPAAEPGPPAGTPTKAEVVSAYEAATGLVLPDMAWFDALTKFKEASATALLLKRARKGGAMPAPMRRMVAGVPALLEESRAALG